MRLFPIKYHNINIYTQLLIGDKDLYNHNDYCSCNVIAKWQIYFKKKHGIVAEYTSTVTSKLK